MIDGFEFGLEGMAVHGTRFIIPPEQAYGPSGVRNPSTGQVAVPLGAILVFEVELLSII